MSSKAMPLLVVLLVIASFAIGSMWTKIQYLQSGTGGQKTTVTTQPTQPSTQQPATPTVTQDQIKKLFTNDYIRFGDANKKVLFVEISDPSCPYCHFASGKNPELAKTASGGRFYPVSAGGSYYAPEVEMKKLVDAGKASFVWMYSNGHGNGEMASQALYCANEKGKFWEAHDLFMSNAGYDLLNSKLKKDASDVQAIADFLGGKIDGAFIKDCLTSNKYQEKIRRDEQVAQTLGFQGTPHFFVNNTPFGGAVDYKQAMEATVLELLK